MTPCDTCVETADHPYFRFPSHLVHPEHGKRMVFDCRGFAICVDCGAAWHRDRNEVRLLGCVSLRAV